MRRTRAALGGLAILISAPCAASGDPDTLEAPAGPVVRAAAEILWSASTALAVEPPVIDGRLNDAAWTLAEPITNFTQVDPEEGEPPTQRTVVRVVHDADNVYIAIQCFDQAPDAIIGKELRRDAPLNSDDRVAIVFDPFGTERDGFFFQMSVTGARRDGLVENNRNIRIEWDGVWWGRTHVDEHGWSAEFRIPAKTLSFDPATDTWGFNVERIIRRRNETVRWATPTRNSSIERLNEAGALTGFENLRQGIGLDVKPSASLTLNDGGPTLLEPSLDLFYKITPAIQATLTFNTDFAETEVDDRRINLTRFPLFFPEKRDFFLQDAGIFEFGGLRQSPLPFFSRRIGIVNGEEKEILAGAKLTGRTEKLTFGVLDVQMKDDPILGSKNLAVGRARYNINDTTAFGVIATNGDPGTTGDNTVVGADFDFLIPDFIGNNTLQGAAFVQRSFSSGTGAPGGGDGYAFGGRLDYPNDPWSFNLFAGQVDSGFNPALGFAPRRGEREYAASTRYRWRFNKIGIRRVDVSFNSFINTDLSNEIVSANYNLPAIEIEDLVGDRLRVFFSPQRERLSEPFEIFDGVVIPVGAYDFNRYGVTFSTSDSRPVSVRLGVTAGDFYGGHREDYEVGLELRPSKHLFLGGELIQNEVTLPQGSFITRIVRIRLNVNFTPDIAWTNFVQYDNVSESAGLNSRLRWTIQPGSDLFVVVNQGFDVTSDRFSLEDTQLVTKIGWTFRF